MDDAQPDRPVPGPPPEAAGDAPSPEGEPPSREGRTATAEPPPATAEPPPATEPEAVEVIYESLGGSEPEGGGEGSLELVYDLSLPLTVELGRTSLTVQEVLGLGRGSVIRLERLAGEPVEIYVGGRRLAEGEVVVLDDQFGVRITRVFPGATAEIGK